MNEELLVNILERHELDEPDGRRLNEYNCTDEEYEELRRILIHHGNPAHLRVPWNGFGTLEPPDDWNWEEKDARDLMACFILYAAEWYRRWNQDKRRTWGQLYSTVHWPPNDYSPLYPAIQYGLSRWKRPIITMPGSRRYFDTIGYEAGTNIEGISVVEYKLISQDDRQAHYQPRNWPNWFHPGSIQIQKSSGEPAPERIVGLFNTDFRR